MISQSRVSVEDFRGLTPHDGSDVAPTPNNLSGEVTLSSFTLPGVINNPDSWYENSSSGHAAWDEESFAALVFSWVFGCYATEQPPVVDGDHVFATYMKNAIKRIKKGKDTGLIHPDTLEIADIIGLDKVSSATENLVSIAEKITAFPPIGSMKVISTLDFVECDFGATDIPAFIPLTVHSSGGITAVSVSINEASMMDASCISRCLHSDSDIDINSFHIWDFSGPTMKRAYPELSYQAENCLIGA